MRMALGPAPSSPCSGAVALRGDVVSNTTTAPTEIDVERYVQISALWHVITGDSFKHALDGLLPDLDLDSLVVEITDSEKEFSHTSLFDQVIPADLDGSPALALTNAR